MKRARALFESRFGLTVQALVVFVVLDAGFRLFGFPGVYRLARWWTPRAAALAAGPARHDVVERAVQAVARATRYYWRRRLDCLPRALTVLFLVRLQGVPATLRIGVKRYPFGAHAWVECEGRVVGDSTSAWRHERYVPIISA